MRAVSELQRIVFLRALEGETLGALSEELGCNATVLFHQVVRALRAGTKEEAAPSEPLPKRLADWRARKDWALECLARYERAVEAARREFKRVYKGEG